MTNINDLIETSLLFLKFKIPENTRIEKIFNAKKNIAVYAEKMQQVFLNILDNGFYAMQKNQQLPDCKLII